MDFDLRVTDDPDRAALDPIWAGMDAFNIADLGQMPNRRALAVFLHDDNGARIDGGLSGSTAWGWLFVEKLWVPEALRGQGLATRLLAAAETEALARGCNRAWLDTINPSACRLYERLGYRPFGALPDYVPGRARTFLWKPLDR